MKNKLKIPLLLVLLPSITFFLLYYLFQKGKFQSLDSMISIWLTSTLVIITAYYAYETNRLTELSNLNTQLNMKINRREIVIDFIQLTLTPLILQLEADRKLFSKIEFSWWHHEKKGYLMYFEMELNINEEMTGCINKLRDDEKEIIKPIIQNKVYSYNKEIKKFKKDIISLIELIDTKEFREKCVLLSENIKSINKLDIPYRAAAYFFDNLLMQRDHFDQKYPSESDLVVFLQKDFIEIGKNKTILKKVESVLQQKNSLEKMCLKLMDSLKKMRENLSEKYNISSDDYSKKGNLRFLDNIS